MINLGVLDEQKIQICSQFRYLGFIIQNDRKIVSDTNHKIQAGWLERRRTTGVLFDRNAPLRLKEKFYIRPGLLMVHNTGL